MCPKCLGPKKSRCVHWNPVILRGFRTWYLFPQNRTTSADISSYPTPTIFTNPWENSSHQLADFFEPGNPPKSGKPVENPWVLANFRHAHGSHAPPIPSAFSATTLYPPVSSLSNFSKSSGSFKKRSQGPNKGPAEKGKRNSKVF